MGFIIMFFHSNAFTVGMMKKGDISMTRTMPRPRKGTVHQDGDRQPENDRDDQDGSDQAERIAQGGPECRIGPEEFVIVEPHEAGSLGIKQVIADRREIERHAQGHDHPQREKDDARRLKPSGQGSIHRRPPEIDVPEYMSSESAVRARMLAAVPRDAGRTESNCRDIKEVC